MATERIIAIDFGTSTSVVRVKRYLDGEPIGDRLETKPVTFNMGSTVVPTLIQQRNTGESLYFGYDAEITRRNTAIFRNFKIEIESPDLAVRVQARELTADFFRFLFKTYREQSLGGHLGETDDLERTIISYPVKWSEETKAFMLETARNAGFPNVEGQDEAQAAIQAVTIQGEQQLRSGGYLTAGQPAVILLVDMGAGTTDLVLCRYTPGDAARTEILATWPHGTSALFGGREVDELLRGYIRNLLPANIAKKVLEKLGTDKFKAWKEHEISPALTRGETVDYFSALDDRLEAMEIDVDVNFSLDRRAFEEFTQGYLRQLPELVNGCLREAGTSGAGVDLVVLTGGHSQWYFVREILSGELSQFGDMGLDRIKADPERIVSITLPHETVALGMTYNPLRTELPRPATKLQSPAAVSESTSSPKPAPVQTSTPAQKLAVTPMSKFKLNNLGNCYEIKKYIGHRSDVVIPAEIQGLSVVSIGWKAFSCNYKLQTVVIPSTVKTIEGYAFDGCDHLRTVIAHAAIEVIGLYAFGSCKRLTRVDFGMGDCGPKIAKFPPSLKLIKAGAFEFFPKMFFLRTETVLKEIWLSKKTEVQNHENGDESFPECTILYYEDFNDK